ncbi:acyltransferase family protein, partial [Nitrospirota bacterium]
MNNHSGTNTEVANYYNGFDYLKVIFILCVVAWHSHIFGDPTKFSHFIYRTMPLLSDIVYMNLFMLAVPVFIQISLFLYLENRPNKTSSFTKRFKQLFITYLFWLFTWMLFKSNGTYAIESSFINLKEILITIVSGRSIVYFLFSLLLCVSILELLLQVEEKVFSINYSWHYWIVTSAILTGVFIAMPYYFSNQGYPYLYWIPMNFFPYISGAVLIHKIKNSSINKKFFIVGGIILYFILSLIEWGYVHEIIWSNYSGHI